ncbi:LysR family transcriptional regulator [Terriglobus roseus]|uniref:LysR family transcriptional regulator, transcription activator of glutamate synthase operon n=1 Tax=Terriglobus roseus TaxID=392734 RepID=A0A1G7KNW3_9BACT|nr:LysR family transcriptional regulator [Terriglobus roseus]SDF38887.1 LysR family transcriptional regulator, transcription activator of glutamate synthase operon [Terriglobus roseus]
MTDFHHLRVFQAVAASGSFTEAGRSLLLSQSTISLHIKQLEAELGCVLFIRGTRRVSLSPAGKVLLAYAERILSEMKNAELAVREYSTTQRGTIRFGVGATTLVYVLPNVLRDYREKYSQIEIQVSTATTEVLLRGLLDQTLDLAVVMSPSAALSQVQTVPLLQENLVVVLPETHPLSTKQILAPRDLDGLPFISHLPGTAMRTVQQHYLDQMQIKPRIAMEMENMEAVKSVVLAGMGVALLPDCCVAGAAGKGLCAKKVRGFPMHRELLLACLQWEAQPPATRRLAQRIQRFCAESGS